MPVRCLTATPCTIEPRPSLIFAAWAITVHAFSALSCNIDKTLFLGNNAPQSSRSSFDRISSLNCFKNRSKTHKRHYVFQNHLFWSKTTFSCFVLRCFYFLSFLPKKCVFAPKTHFFAHFSLYVAFCKKRRPNAPFLSFYAFLSLFATISSMNRSSENTVEMPVGGGNDITLSKCRSSPAR